MDYSSIDGWFCERDAEFYRYQVKRVRAPATFVEIGSYKGRSSVCMAKAIRDSGKQIDFYCIDTWMGSEEHRNAGGRLDNLYNEFSHNVAEVREYIQPIRMASVQAAAEFSDESCDFVFIDAAHDYESVSADVQAWLPKVKPNGVLAGHDYVPGWQGVVRAVNDAFGPRVRTYGTCWYVAARGQAAPFSMREWRKLMSRRLRRSFSRPGRTAACDSL